MMDRIDLALALGMLCLMLGTLLTGSPGTVCLDDTGPRTHPAGNGCRDHCDEYPRGISVSNMMLFPCPSPEEGIRAGQGV